MATSCQSRAFQIERIKTINKQKQLKVYLHQKLDAYAKHYKNKTVSRRQQKLKDKIDEMRREDYEAFTSSKHRGRSN